mgnify:CR=1 FL=1
MRRDATSVGVVLGDHDPGGDGHRVPAALPGNAPGETPLSIQAREQLLDVHELGLQLDHEHDPLPRVPGEDVDRAALAEYRECDLRVVQPAVVGEVPGELVVELRVTRGE